MVRQTLGEAIVTTVALVVAVSLPIWMPTGVLATPIYALEQARPKPAPLASELPKPSGRAAQLTGTVAQPYAEELLPVPIPPSGAETPNPRRSGGPVETAPLLPDWLMQIQNPDAYTDLSPYPVIRPAQQPAAEQTNVINLSVP